MKRLLHGMLERISLSRNKMKLFVKDRYEKLFVKTKTVHDYEWEIAQAKEKIKELQSNCKHESITDGFSFPYDGVIVPYRTCLLCKANLRMQEEEIRALMDSFIK